MKENKIPLLKAKDVECRIGKIGEKGLSLLLYKDARCDMAILDEVFGPLGWKRTHREIGGNLFCTISIWDNEKKCWVEKEDVGVSAFSEKEKSQSSDSFKRCSVNVGIGRELYTAPFIWISNKKCKIEKSFDKYVCKDSFKVSHIAYNKDREITELNIVNQEDAIVYEYREKARKPVVEQVQYITIENLDQLNAELDRTGVSIEAVLNRYGLDAVHKMTPEIFKSAMNSLSKTASRSNAA